MQVATGKPIEVRKWQTLSMAEMWGTSLCSHHREKQNQEEQDNVELESVAWPAEI